MLGSCDGGLSYISGHCSEDSLDSALFGCDGDSRLPQQQSFDDHDSTLNPHADRPQEIMLDSPMQALNMPDDLSLGIESSDDPLQEALDDDLGPLPAELPDMWEDMQPHMHTCPETEVAWHEQDDDPHKVAMLDGDNLILHCYGTDAASDFKSPIHQNSHYLQTATDRAGKLPWHACNMTDGLDSQMNVQPTISGDGSLQIDDDIQIPVWQAELYRNNSCCQGAKFGHASHGGNFLLSPMSPELRQYTTDAQNARVAGLDDLTSNGLNNTWISSFEQPGGSDLQLEHPDRYVSQLRDWEVAV